MTIETAVKLETPSFCDECGAPIPPGSRFCNKCGKPLYVPPAEAAAPAPPVEELCEATVTLAEPVPEPAAPTPPPAPPEPAAPTPPPMPPEPAAPTPPPAPPAPPAAPEVKPAEVPEPKKAKKPKKAGGVAAALTFLLCILLVPCALCFMVLLMLRILFSDITIPSMGGLDGAFLTGLANALYPLIVSGVLLVLLLVLVIVLNRGRFRRVFLALGLSTLVLGLLVGLAGMFANAYVAPFQLGDTLTREYIVFFRELALLVSTICSGAGLFFTAAYLLAAALKKEKPSKREAV